MKRGSPAETIIKRCVIYVAANVAVLQAFRNENLNKVKK